MSRIKRKQPDSSSPSESLTEQEQTVFNLIKSKEGMGIWVRDLKNNTNLSDIVVNKAVKTLQSKQLIKEVSNVQFKGRKHYMAAEFEPSKAVTGGDWYENGSIDKDYVEGAKNMFAKLIYQKKVATAEEFPDLIRKSGIFTEKLTKQQIEEILRILVLENRITEVESTGIGEFTFIQAGKICYKCTSKGGVRVEPKVGAMASIPCGVCPRISHCTPDGIISPTTCIYYSKWLDF